MGVETSGAMGVDKVLRVACTLYAWSSTVPGYSREGLQMMATQRSKCVCTNCIFIMCMHPCDNVDMQEVLWRRETLRSVVIASQEGDEGCNKTEI